MVNQEMREMIMPMTSRAIGMTKSLCRKVRCTSASESAGGAHQVGISLVRPNCLAAGDCTRYWFHSRPLKAPVSAAISPAAT